MSKIITYRQANNVVELIIDMAIRAQKRGEIAGQEQKAIINFTSSATAAIRLLEEMGIITNDFR